MGIVGRVAALDADGVDFRDILGHCHKGGHGAERLAAEIGIQAGYDYPDAHAGELLHYVDYAHVEELGLVDADHVNVSGEEQQAAGRLHGGRDDGVGIMAHHFFFGVADVDPGLENLALLSLRINSSVLPENIEPQMTSIQPGVFAFSINIICFYNFIIFVCN